MELSSVDQMLRSHYVDGVWNTHVSVIQPKRSYYVGSNVSDDLWKLYCDAVYKNEAAVIGLAEKPQQYLPILVDIDLKINEDDCQDWTVEKPPCTDMHITQVVEVYQSVLRDAVEDCTDEQLTCVVLNKPPYRIIRGDTSWVKNGFHLHFPSIFLRTDAQKVHIIPRAKDLIKKMDIFADLGIEDSSSLVDEGVLTVCWLMYGSRKQENMDPYRLSKIIDAGGDEIELEDAFAKYNVYDANERLINIRGQVEYNLPRILSIIPEGRETHEIRHGMVPLIKERMQRDRKKNIYNTTVSVSDALTLSRKLLPMLSDFRAIDRHEWMTIGWALYSIGEGSIEALEQWLEFSERSPEYDETACISAWEKMVQKDITLGTLRYYASLDNPDAYKELKCELANNHVKEALNGSHTDIARLLYEEYSNEFVCASMSTKSWYQFRNHVWNEIECGVYLSLRISNDVVKQYIHLGVEALKGESDDAANSARTDAARKLIKNLKTAPYKANVMKEAAEIFYDSRFKEKLNLNPNLIAFKNGVYDLKINSFRIGRPEDFLSIAMPIRYSEFSPMDEAVTNVYDFLEKIFPDTSIRKYFLDIYCDIFVGGNKKKIVLFWTGDGDNGKSVMQTLFERMLGRLAIKFETTLLTGKKVQMGAASPELARAGPPVRHAILEEPDNDERLNVGILKKLSGNDSYWARDLFEPGKAVREVLPQFTLSFVCNKLPELNHPDPATWNRIRVIPYEATFVRPGEPCPETYEEQLRQKRFPMDLEFSDKIPDMVEAFAWVLLEHRKKPRSNFEPEKVRQATAVYRRQNDVYRQFVEECVTEEKEGKITMVEVYAAYKEWFKEGFPGRQVISKNELKGHMNKLWGDSEPGPKWSGYRMKSQKDNYNEDYYAEEDEKQTEDVKDDIRDDIRDDIEDDIDVPIQTCSDVEEMIQIEEIGEKDKKRKERRTKRSKSMVRTGSECEEEEKEEKEYEDKQKEDKKKEIKEIKVKKSKVKVRKSRSVNPMIEVV